MPPQIGQQFVGKSRSGSMVRSTPSWRQCFKSLFEMDRRTALIDKLNEAVERKTGIAVKKAKENGTELGPAFAILSRNMSPGGVWAGAPVYVRRGGPVWITVLVLSFLATHLLYSMYQIGISYSLLCMIISYFWYDLFSGIIHVVLDEPSNISLPIMGQPALEFQWHHYIPTDIVRKDFIDVVGDLNVLSLILGSFHFFYSTNCGTCALASTLGHLKLAMGYFGQYSHRSAHDPKIGSKPVGNFLQRYGFMISVRAHKEHHQPPHEEDFCLIGIMNPVITKMRKFTTHPMAWLVGFLFVSVVDIKILTCVINATFGSPTHLPEM